MNRIKRFSEVRLKDGRAGTIVDIYEEPTLGYGVDFVSEYSPDSPFPEEIYGVVKPQEIEEVIWQPED